jgi:RNA polymerase sigma-70 factor (ECF subfamily)
MKYSKRLEIFERVRAEYSVFLISVLWKLTGDRELFAEAMQYTLLGMWRNVEKLNSKKAGAYIYRIALTANSKAWRNRIGKDGQISQAQAGIEKNPPERVGRSELTGLIRRAIAQLPAKQGRALVMRYLQQQSYQTIAERLSCSEVGARSNVSKALATLKVKLADLAEGGQ